MLCVILNDHCKIISPKKTIIMTKISFWALSLLLGLSLLSSCNNADTSKATAEKEVIAKQVDTPEYFNLRPKLEKDYGYSHAVKIGDDLKISGAVSYERLSCYSCTRKHGTTNEKLL